MGRGQRSPAIRSAQNLMNPACLPSRRAQNNSCKGSSLSFFLARPRAAMKDLSPRIIQRIPSKIQGLTLLPQPRPECRAPREGEEHSQHFPTAPGDKQRDTLRAEGRKANPAHTSSASIHSPGSKVQALKAEAGRMEGEGSWEVSKPHPKWKVSCLRPHSFLRSSFQTPAALRPSLLLFIDPFFLTHNF